MGGSVYVGGNVYKAVTVAGVEACTSRVAFLTAGSWSNRCGVVGGMIPPEGARRHISILGIERGHIVTA